MLVRRWRLGRAVGLVMLFALFSAPAGLAQVVTGWHTEIVDSGGFVGWDSSLAIDASGQVHISYRDTTNQALKYSVLTTTGWQTTTVDNTGNVGQFTSLKLDSAGQPHISYYEATNGDLKYAAFNGTSWQIETVDDIERVGVSTALALDALDRPHIRYSDVTNGQIKYAAFNGTGWDIEVIDSAGSTGGSLALDTLGRPHVSYYDNSTGDLKYAVKTSAGWQIMWVDLASNLAPTLALDAVGRPHISVTDTSEGSLKYAVLDSNVWQIETVPTATPIGTFSSLAIDLSNTQPHISYYDATDNDLKYAVKTATGWQIETADSVNNVGQYAALALDDDGHPHISYLDFTEGDLKYARFSINHPPTVEAGGPYSGAEGSPITLDVTVDDPESDDLTTSWSYTINSADAGTTCTFGDPSQVETTFTCTDDGSFTVTLTASDGLNPLVTDTATVTISNVEPTVTLGSGVTINQGDTFTDTGSFTDPGSNDTHSATVNYGAGEGAQPLTLNPDGSFSLSHTYDDNGQFTVTVCVTDDDSGMDCDELVVQVVNQPPTVAAGGPYTGAEGSPVSLGGTINDPENDVPTTTWSYTIVSADPGTTCTFGDANVVDTTFSCTDDGSFAVTLSADDGINPPVTNAASVTISNVAPTVTLGEDAEIDEGDPFSATGSFSDPGLNDTHTATVDYGDSSGSQPLTLNPDGSFTLNHSYADDGQYTVEVCVSDDDQGTDCAELTVTALNVAPTIHDVSFEIINTQVTVTVIASDPAGVNDPLSYAFDCNQDDVYEVGPQPGNSATCPLGVNEGSFTIGVQVSDDDGGIATSTVTITIATHLCANNYTGVVRYTSTCQTHETSITLPEDGPVAVCANNSTRVLRAPSNGACTRHETRYVLPEDGPLTVCVNRHTQVVRVVDNLGQCMSHETGRVLAATAISSTPPRSR